MQSKSTSFWLGLFALLGGWAVVIVVLGNPSSQGHSAASALWVERMGPIEAEVIGHYKGIHVESARLTIASDQRLELNFGTPEWPDTMGASWHRQDKGTLSGLLDPVPGTTWTERDREFFVYPRERALVMSFYNGWSIVMFKRDPE